MTDQTANLRLSKPDFNQPLWHDLVNDNWEIIDATMTTYLTITGIIGPWENSTGYVVGNKVIDTDTSTLYECFVNHTSAASPTTFEEDRQANPTYWSAPAIVARGLGSWTPSTPYEPNDFVIGTGNIFAVCIASHTSSADFATDAAYWDYLLDLSTLGSLPAITGADANKYLRTNGTATASTWVAPSQINTDLGLGTISTQSAASVNITGGAIVGITDLAVADGGTGASTASTARDNLGVSGMFQTTQVFTSGGTWTKPSGLKRVKVTCVGGGGAGGGAGASAAGESATGGGGGGGQTAISWIEAGTLGSTVTVTVGAGGTGASGSPGNGGGTTSFGAHVIADGGDGGSTSSVNVNVGPGGNGGTGGDSGTGQILIEGSPGGWGFKNAGGVGVNGWGGSSAFGGGAKPFPTTTSGAGAAANANTGGGGTGAQNHGSSSARAGGAGGSGIVIVEEFY